MNNPLFSIGVCVLVFIIALVYIAYSVRATKKDKSIGTVVSDIENLRNYRLFKGKYAVLKKINLFLAVIIFVAGFICSRNDAIPVPVSICLYVLFLVCLIGGETWIGHYDDRVYVSERDVIFQTKGIMKRYPWFVIKKTTLLSNGVMIEFIDNSQMILRNINEVDELMLTLNKHIDQREG